MSEVSRVLCETLHDGLLYLLQLEGSPLLVQAPVHPITPNLDPQNYHVQYSDLGSWGRVRALRSNNLKWEEVLGRAA